MQSRSGKIKSLPTRRPRVANRKAAKLLLQLLAVVGIKLIVGLLGLEEDLFVGEEAVAANHPDAEESQLILRPLNEGSAVLDTSVVNTIDGGAANRGTGRSHWIVEGLVMTF